MSARRTTTAGPRLIAAAYGNSNPEVVQILLETCADIGTASDGWTPLLWLAKYNRAPEVVRVLLDAGAEVDARDVDGWTPLMIAASYNSNPETVWVLLHAGADPEARNSAGETAWDLIQHNENLAGTDAYWELNDLRLE